MAQRRASGRSMPRSGKRWKAKRLPAGRGKPVMHDCRHTFGAMLVAEGCDVLLGQGG